MPLRLSSSLAFAILRPACGVGADKKTRPKRTGRIPLVDTPRKADATLAASSLWRVFRWKRAEGPRSFVEGKM